MMPLGVIMVLLTPASAALIGRAGPRWTLVTGAAIVGAGYGLPVIAGLGLAQVTIATAVVGVGIGLGYAAMPTLVMNATPAGQIGAANGPNTLMRALGTTIGSAVVGAILSAGPASGGFPSVGSFRLVAGLALAAGLVSAAVAAGATSSPRNGRSAAPATSVPLERTTRQ